MLSTTKAFLSLLIGAVLTACSVADSPASGDRAPAPYDGRPYARYWWFAQEMDTLTIRDNLDWLKTHGFGGVEVAFVYPLNRMDKRDTAYIPRDEWLGPEWQNAVRYTRDYAAELGLGCDLTGGSLWPFGDVGLDSTIASRTYGRPDYRQPITAHWAWPQQGLVVDHLTPAHYWEYFFGTYGKYPPGRPGQSLFVDSWEVETRGLWSETFGDDFAARYGYRIEPFMDSLYAPGRETQRYDYHALLSDKVVRFYADFTATSHAHGYRSRGQASGAPADILSAYAQLDVPEGELMLYEPEYNRIPAAAATLAGKPIVSAETFTCLYGWPRNYQRRAQLADLKLVADAAFTNGINQIFWHGKPHSPLGTDSVTFYATVHLGDSAAITPHLAAFNDYLTKVSRYLQRGRTYSRALAYLPTEDAWRAGEMPRDRQFIWAWGHYEMRYVYPAPELRNYNPTWVNGDFLAEARVVDNGEETVLLINDQAFPFLYLDADFLAVEHLRTIEKLARAGGRVTLKSSPRLAGTGDSLAFDRLLDSLRALPSVTAEIPRNISPIVSGPRVPPYWTRVSGDSLFLFVAPRRSAGLTFPLGFGQSYEPEGTAVDMTVAWRGETYGVRDGLPPYQSGLYVLARGRVQRVKVDLAVPEPVREYLPEGEGRPWRVNE